MRILHLLPVVFLVACGAKLTSTKKYIPQPGCQKVDCAELFEGIPPLDPKADDDNDGVPNESDGAPLIPEDKDGVADADGIPDPDPPPAEAPPPPAKGKKSEKVANVDPRFTPPSDVDNDGVPDAFDACFKDPEDKDGFEDTDGCPEPDNDQDGVLDGQDKCPNVPGTDCK